MTSPFAAAARAADSVIDNTFSELVRVQPQASGEYAATADPHRPAFETRAVVSFSSQVLQAQGYLRDDSTMPLVAADTVTVSFREQSLAGLRLQPGDRIVLRDRGDLAVMISGIEPDGQGRINARCMRAPT